MIWSCYVINRVSQNPLIFLGSNLNISKSLDLVLTCWLPKLVTWKFWEGFLFVVVVLLLCSFCVCVTTEMRAFFLPAESPKIFNLLELKNYFSSDFLSTSAFHSQGPLIDLLFKGIIKFTEPHVRITGN